MRTKRVVVLGGSLAILATLVCLGLAEPAGAAITQPFNLTWGTTGPANGQFNAPRALDVDASGNVYVADRANNRIQVFSRSGTFVRVWGTAGSGNSQFNAPNDVAVDSAGNVYVADTNNHRIQVFSSTGTFVRKWGTAGSSDGQFSSPQGVAVNGTSVFVADTANNRIQVFSTTGAFVRKWGALGAGDGQFNSPRDVVAGSASGVFVADTLNRRIQRFSTTGTFQTKWGSAGSGNGQFNSPRGLDLAGGGVVVADTLNNRLQRFDTNGVFQEVVGSAGGGNGQFSSPHGVAGDSLGNLFVADTSNNRVQRFGFISEPLPQVASWATGASPLQPGVDAAGNLYVPVGLDIKKFAPDGTLMMQFAAGTAAFELPRAVTVDGAGTIYVARNGVIVKFSAAGQELSGFGGGDGFNTPNGLVISPTNGHLYFSDDTDGGVWEYTTSGTFVRRWSVLSARGIAIDGSGAVYVSSSLDGIQRFSATGTLLATIVDDDQFNLPRGLALDAQGDLLVVDSSANTLVEYTTAGVLLSTRTGLSGPVGVAADTRGNAYVSDTGTGRALRFAASGSLQGTVAGGGAGLYVLAMQVGSFGLVRGTYTDSGGNYAMTVPPGRYIVAFVDPGGTRTFEWFNDKADITQVGESDFVTVPAGGQATANATLAGNGVTPPPVGATLTGTVSGASGGVANAFVYAVDLISGRQKGAKANASGQYTISGLHASSGYRVLFVDPTNANLAEWFDNHAQVDLANATAVTLTAGATTSLSVTLADNPTL